METGKLIVTKTKSGFAGKIAFVKPDGKAAELPLSIKFNDDRLNGTDCTFKREAGQLVRLIAHDDKVLYEKQAAAPGNFVQNEGAASRPSFNAQIRVPDIFSLSETCLPQDTRQKSGVTTIDNFALKLNKGAYFDHSNEDERKWKFYLAKTDRKGYIKKIEANYGEINTRFIEIAARQKSSAEILCPENNCQTFHPDWRFVVGLGGESVYETSITLHHVYGFPYIPASSVKGVVRSWIIIEKFSSDEKEALKDVGFCEIFGCPEGSGKKDEKGKAVAYMGNISFFDAFPLRPPQVEPDIMNPHFSKYYSEGADKAKTFPVDYDNPIPVNFLSVVATPFEFIVGLRKGKENKQISMKDENGALLDLASAWLKKALEEHGIGAKTAVGYGYMRPV